MPGSPCGSVASYYYTHKPFFAERVKVKANRGRPTEQSVLGGTGWKAPLALGGEGVWSPAAPAPVQRQPALCTHKSHTGWLFADWAPETRGSVQGRLFPSHFLVFSVKESSGPNLRSTEINLQKQNQPSTTSVTSVTFRPFHPVAAQGYPVPSPTGRLHCGLQTPEEQLARMFPGQWVIWEPAA